MRKKYLLLLLFPTLIFGHTLFSRQCRVSGLQYQNGFVHFFSQHTAKPRLYAIHNISHSPLWLVHPVKSGVANAGWNSYSQPNRWTAILVTRRRFSLLCQIPEKSGRMVTVNCSKVIHVCQFSSFYSNHPLSGGYWVAENVLFRDLGSRVRQRGFVVQ